MYIVLSIENLQIRWFQLMMKNIFYAINNLQVYVYYSLLKTIFQKPNRLVILSFISYLSNRCYSQTQSRWNAQLVYDIIILTISLSISVYQICLLDVPWIHYLKQWVKLRQAIISSWTHPFILSRMLAI